jgi:putative ABC transport system ATP-binding protein
MSVLYDLEGVSRVFKLGGTEVRAVDDVSLSIQTGEFIAIEGPSGSGKSTMLQLLGALDRPTAGRMTFETKDLGALGESARTKLRREAIGFVFQHFNLIPTLTAAENVETALAPTKAPKGGRSGRVMTLLSQVGLEHRADHLPSRLSGGEQQRVAIARALANSPRVLLADEPTGNLDTRTSAEVVDLLGSLVERSNVTVVMVTHAEDVARRAARRITMRDGRVVDPVDLGLVYGPEVV